MGYEYTIRFEIDDVNEVSALLKSLPNFHEVKSFKDSDQYIYNLSESSSKGMHSGLAEIQANGIYFCDFGEGESILKEMIFRIGLSYKKLEVIDHND